MECFKPKGIPPFLFISPSPSYVMGASITTAPAFASVFDQLLHDFHRDNRVILAVTIPAINIPAGYQIADGSNGTDNAQGALLVGYGGGFSIGDTGGSDSWWDIVNAGHTHNVSVNIGGSGGGQVANGALNTGSDIDAATLGGTYSSIITDPNVSVTINGGGGGTSYGPNINPHYLCVLFIQAV